MHVVSTISTKLPVVAALALALVCGCGGGDATDASTPPPDGGWDAAPSCSVDDDCEDGLACNGLATCQEGRCVRGAPLDCDDGLDCTVDRCSEEVRGCVHRGPDEDADGHVAASCLDERGMPLGDDCDDGAAGVHPGALELCDAMGIDEDCDPTTLGGRDGDGDGYVDAACCNGARCGDDCNDAVRGASPEGTEVCNGIDDDCDGSIDEGVLVLVFRDVDGDGHGDPMVSRMACAGTSGYVADGDDCDDTNAARSPALFEACDGIDNDCDGVADPDDVPEVVSWYVDADGDGFGDREREVPSCAIPGAGYSLLGTDCDDGNRARHPGQAEACNGLDDDCNGRADFEIAPGDTEDDDLDGRPDARCTPRPSADVADCDDRDASSGPGGAEICDGRDNDCDGSVDEGVEATPFYRDLDGDGFGSAVGGSVLGCGTVAGYVERAGDCDDANEDRHPGAQEHCDGSDEDCDGQIDEALGAESCTSIGDVDYACVAGRCRVVLACSAPLADCDGLAFDGCETNLTSDAAHCGTCGRSCAGTEPHTGGTCAGGTCALACSGGFADCDATLGGGGNGCETALGTDGHCASCTDACGAGMRCNPALRTCEPIGGGCAPPLEDCDANGSCETDLSASLTSCGMCGRACVGMNASWDCVSGACTVSSCTGAFLDCDGMSVNGCEVNGATITNCRMCGRACSGLDATWACGPAGCEVAGCVGPAADCDASPSNGCEVRLDNDARHCGSCARDCYETHATAGCIAGACGPRSCEPGYADCNGDLGSGGDGCETLGTCPLVGASTTWGDTGDDSPFFSLMDVAVDASGNTYVAVSFSTSLRLAGTTHTAAGLGALVFSLDSTLGTVRWARVIGASVMGDATAWRIAVGSGTVVVAGDCAGAGNLVSQTDVLGALGSTNQPYVAAFSASTGAYQWSRILVAAEGADARALDIGASGVVVVGGFTLADLELRPGTAITGANEGWVARLGLASGTPMSITAFGGPGAFVAVQALDVRDFDGDVFVGGMYSGGSWVLGGTTLSIGGGNDAWAARCTGGLMCGQVYTAATAADEVVTDVRVGPSAHWVFAGAFTGGTTVAGTTLSASGTGGFVAGVTYMGMGGIDWVRGSTGTGTTSMDGVRRVQIDATNHVLALFSESGDMASLFGGTATISVGVLTPHIAVIEGDTGALLQLQSFDPVSLPVDALAIATFPDRRSVIVGSIAGTTPFTSTTLTSAGGVDQFAARVNAF